MGDVTKETLNVAGLLTNVYARSSSSNPSEHIVVLFFLHGRGESADSVDSTARAAFAWVDEKQASSKRSPTPPKDFIVITFDQRNHGHRTVDKHGNLGWSHKPELNNERHAIDQYGVITGAVKDLSFLIDILPAYLFPNDERTIGEWVLGGFSLGGHATWLALRQEPRIRIGIPICGCPNYLPLMEQRAERHGVPRTPPYFPASLRALVRVNDTVPAITTAFAGKRVLVLAGADDKLVPWETSRTFVETLDVGRGGRKVVVVVPGVKHEFTDGMREEMFQFFWEEALIRGAAVLNSAL